MNVLQGLDLVHIKVLGILSADYSRSSPKQVFFLKSAFNVSLMLDESALELCILPRKAGHRSDAPQGALCPDGDIEVLPVALVASLAGLLVGPEGATTPASHTDGPWAMLQCPL